MKRGMRYGVARRRRVSVATPVLHLSSAVSADFGITLRM